MTFTEDWFSEASQLALARLAREVSHLEGDIVEVGCWEGRSTIALARAAQPEVVHAVDTWQGSPGEISQGLAAQRDVFGTFLANVELLTEGNVVPHRMSWRAYFKDHRDPIKLIHIDAGHTHDEVWQTIATVLPLVRPGGIICGDDAHHHPIQRAVMETLGAPDLDASLWIHRRPGVWA